MNYNGVCKTDIGFAWVCLKAFNLKATKKITKSTPILETKKKWPQFLVSAVLCGVSLTLLKCGVKTYYEGIA